MEFIDPVVAEDEAKAEAQDIKALEQSPNDQNQKTEEVVERLESEINKTYDLVEKQFASLWTNARKNAQGLQEQIKLEERKSEIISQLNKARESIGKNENVAKIDAQVKELGESIKNLDGKINLQSITSQADSALDTLDSKLEIVEQQAGKYVSQFTSFFSNMISIDSGVNAPEPEDEKETLFSSENYGTSRYETELYKLHTTSSYFEGTEEQPEEKQFNADTKTAEITALLNKYPDTLQKLMNDLVPVKVSYNVFWCRYFKAETDLKVSEEKRKELLDKQTASTAERSESGDEEEFTWDDDDDDEPHGSSLNSTPQSTTKTSSKPDDEDDDWE